MVLSRWAYQAEGQVRKPTRKVRPDQLEQNRYFPQAFLPEDLPLCRLA